MAAATHPGGRFQRLSDSTILSSRLVKNNRITDQTTSPGTLHIDYFFAKDHVCCFATCRRVPQCRSPRAVLREQCGSSLRLNTVAVCSANCSDSLLGAVGSLVLASLSPSGLTMSRKLSVTKSICPVGLTGDIPRACRPYRPRRKAMGSGRSALFGRNFFLLARSAT